MNRRLILAAAGLFALALVMGGGARQGFLSDSIVQLVSLCIVIAMALSWSPVTYDRFYLSLLLMIFALPLFHLLPLPFSAWSWLSGRETIAAHLVAVGIDPSFSIFSLRPDATLQSFFALLPALVIALVLPDASLQQRVGFVLILSGFVVASIIIAFLQIIGGQSSGLYFYDVTSYGRAVGFFANPNHFAALLYASLPLTLAVFAEHSERVISRPFVTLGAVSFIWLVGLSISGSRTALILGFASLGLSFVAFVRHVLPHHVSARRLILSGILLALILMPVLLGVGLTTILGRFETQDVLQDDRSALLPAGLELLRHYFPFGSGFGSFSGVYAAFETPSILLPDIVNHLHNDWIEVVIEGGLPALMILGAWLVFFGKKVRTIVFLHNDLSGRLAKAGLISISLIALHSVWDYPLRTIALMAIFALAHACLVPVPRPRHELQEGEPHRAFEAWDLLPRRRRRRHSREFGVPISSKPGSP